MKKIAIICQSVGIVNRGAETFITEFVRNMKDEYQIDVYSRGESIGEIGDNIITVKCKDNICLKCYTKLYNKSKLLRYILNRTRYTHPILPNMLYIRKFQKVVYTNYICKAQYDLLFPQNGFWSAWYANKYRKRNKTPFLYVGHGGIGAGEWWILKTRPNMYISISNKQFQWAKQYYNNVILLHHGVNVEDFLVNEKIHRNQKIVLSVGALTDDYKRHSLTIEAVSMLSDVKLIILGVGRDREKYIELLERKLPGRYEINCVSYAKINEYYKNADLFVLPSLEEAFGIVYLEAMAANLPIVAPNDEARMEIIGNAGLYCDVTNIDEYAETIEKALKMDWGEKPLERARLFDWKEVKKKYYKVIESLL